MPVGLSIPLITNPSNWTPLSLGTALRAWYFETYDSVNGIWKDETGNFSTTPYTGGGATIPQSGTINGHNAVNFAGTGDSLLVTNGALLNGSNACTFGAVIKPDSFSSLQTIIGRTYSFYGFWFGAGYSTSPNPDVSTFWVSDGTLIGDKSQTAYTNNSIPLQPTTSVLIGQYDGTTTSIYYNGVLQNATATTAYASINEANDAVLIGAVGDTTPSAPSFLYLGLLGNIVVCNTALNSSDLSRLNAYLSKWAGV